MDRVGKGEECILRIKMLALEHWQNNISSMKTIIVIFFVIIFGFEPQWCSFYFIIFP